jgi:hypothetical protein
MISSKNPYPTKVRRLQQLQQLEDAGLNVAPFVWFPPGELKISDLKRFFERYGPASISFPILEIAPTFFFQFSCLRLFIPVESKHKAAFASFSRMPPF